HGVAFADFDNDGDQDIFEQMGGVYRGDTYPSALYQNPGHGHHWLQLELVGTRSNRDGIGARVTVTVRDGMVRGSTVRDGSAPGTPGERRIHRRVGTGGSFGGSPLRLEIGLGACQAITRLEVFWPASGERQRFDDVRLDRRYEVREGHEQLREISVARLTLGVP
ncbi:MAG: ASPIC/UnbV domain-containing protein, partial [Acidobacteriota bacterium]